MASSYDDAVATLYRAPHESFVVERKRLADALKASGDKAAAARLGKALRPTLSAWAVNQLWWHAREEFERMLQTAAELRAGKLQARDAHRKAQAALIAHAQRLLGASGHTAQDALLRRIATTLSGLAASGGFAPDAPGTLSKDRDPPGFEAFGAAEFAEKSSAPAIEPRAPDRAAHPREQAVRAREQAASEQKAREQKAREQKAAAEAQAKRHAERRELEAQLREAKAKLGKLDHERARLARALSEAESEAQRAEQAVSALQAKLAKLQTASES